MKRILSTLLMTMLMGMTTAMAEELRVAEMTLDLSKDYSNESTGLTSGSYNYNHNTKELVLNNVTITSISGSGKLTGIYSSVAGLTIRFLGTNNITTKYEGLYLDAKTDLLNEGTVNITSNNYEAIYIRNTTTVNIYYGVWNLKGNSGIKGNDKNQTVNIYNDTSKSLTLVANGTNGCIWNLKALNLDNVVICNPYPGDFISNAVCREGSSSPVKGQDVVIGTAAFLLGGQVCATYATGQTKISGSNITGSVTYYHSSKTLKMVNAEVNGIFVPCLDDMTLICTGTNTIHGNASTLGFYSIQLCDINNFTIRGSGTLNIDPIRITYSDDYSCPNLNIQEGVTVNVTNNQTSGPGIYVDFNNYNYSRHGKVTIKNSTLNINVNAKTDCITCLTSLDGSIIKSPLQTILLEVTVPSYYDPVYDNSYGYFFMIDRQTTLKGSLSIEPGTAYGLWVNGVRVNESNYSNLSSMGNSGSCSYNPSSKRLTLHNAIITYDKAQYVDPANYPAIYNKINGLVINNEGTSEIGGDFHGIESEADFTITGNGHLKVTGTGKGGIQLMNCNLTVDNTEMTVTGGKYGIYASGQDTGKRNVILNNSYLHLTSNPDINGSMAVYVKSFDPNCQVVFPVNGIIKNGYIYEADGKTYAKKAEIEPKKGISTAIDAVAPIEEAGETSIYTTSGTLVWKGKGQPQLPQGVYIFKNNGKVQKVQLY